MRDNGHTLAWAEAADNIKANIKYTRKALQLLILRTRITGKRSVSEIDTWEIHEALLRAW